MPVWPAAVDNIAEAVAVLFDVAAEVNRTRSADLAGLLQALGACLGLLQAQPRTFLQAGAGIDDSAIQALISQRDDAKRSRDFATADRIRTELADLGIVLKDSPGGTTWETTR